MPAAKTALVTRTLRKRMVEMLDGYGVQPCVEAFCEALQSKAAQMATVMDDPDLAVLYNDFANHIREALSGGHKLTKASSMVLKSTGTRKFIQGEHSGRSRLTEADVIEARKRVYQGEAREQVFLDLKRAKKTITREYFNRVIRGDAWGHLVTGYEVKMARGGKVRLPGKRGPKPKLD